MDTVKVTLTHENDTITVEDDIKNLYNWVEGNYSCDCNRGLIMGYEQDFDCNLGGNKVHVKITNGDVVIYED